MAVTPTPNQGEILAGNNSAWDIHSRNIKKSHVINEVLLMKLLVKDHRYLASYIINQQQKLVCPAGFNVFF